MKIEILGHGGAFDPTSTAFLIDRSTLIDCGMDVVKQLIASDRARDITDVYITHIHQDHIGGFETLAYYKRYVLNDPTPLRVVCPDEFYSLYTYMACYETFGRDGIRFQPAHDPKILRPDNAVVVFDGPMVTSFIVIHSSLEAYGYIVRNIDAQTYAIFSGDTDTVLPNILIQDAALTFVFHDVGWTGLPDRVSKVHPTETEVFEKYGNTKIVGIHTYNPLTHLYLGTIGDTFIL